MELTILLVFVFLTVFLVLTVLLIKVFHTSKEVHYQDHILLPERKQAHTNWRDVVFKQLVMRPWPYKDIYNPLNRLYWPDEQADNREHRRHNRRKRNT